MFTPQAGIFALGTSSHAYLEFDLRRFVSECGFRSFPEMKAVERSTAPEERTSIFTSAMLAHQKNSAGNSIINDRMTRYYG